MKRSLGASFAAVSVLFWVHSSWGGQSDRYMTKTLLPVEERVLDQSDRPVPLPQSLLWIQQDPVRRIALSFDLNGLPRDLNAFTRCSLRIVASNPQYVPADNTQNTGGDRINLLGKLSPSTESIVSFNTIGTRMPVAIGNDPGPSGEPLGLCSSIKDRFTNNGDRRFTIILETNDDKAGALFYSRANAGTPPSDLPRLVIEYTLPPPGLLESASWPQHQQNPEHTGRGPWIPFRAPNGFSLIRVPLPKIDGNEGTVVDYPLIWEGNMYLIAKVLRQNYLLSLDFRGTERWRQNIGAGPVQRSPVISRDGILYAVTESQITGYDLKASGNVKASYTLPPGGQTLSAYTGLTQGNDGSLFLSLAENDSNYILGLTPSLEPFLKAGPFATGQDKISTVTVSPNGRKILAQTPKGAVVIDVANPSEQRTFRLENGKDQPWEYYYVPVAGAAGDVGIMIFSDFTSKANKGNVWGYSEEGIIWNASGTLPPQPVLGSNGRVYYIQGGELKGHACDQMGTAAITAGAGLNTTSNLVMDSANNIYFWDNGYLHGYGSEGVPLFTGVDLTKEGLEKQRTADPEAVSGTEKAVRNDTSSGPEQFIRLTMGPDGTLWVNNRNGNALYAFKPTYASADLTVERGDITSQTVYRATGTLTVGDVSIDEGAQVLFQAQNGVGFTRGFKVQKGASILARTGF
jgi:hypothetical protein